MGRWLSFQQQPVAHLDPVTGIQGAQHRRDGGDVGFDNTLLARVSGRLRTDRGEAGQAGGGIRHIAAIQSHMGQTFHQGGGLGVEPADRFQRDQGLQQRKLLGEL